MSDHWTQHVRYRYGLAKDCFLTLCSRPVAPGGATMKLPASLTAAKKRDPHEYIAPIEIDTIHRALFANTKKKSVGKKPLFTITMPKKSKV